MEFVKADIHNYIKTMEDNCIDMIYTNPPFGTTEQKWDKPLDWENLFPEMWRVLKPNGIIVLHCAIPFTYQLMRFETPKYHYTWKKKNPTGFFQAKKQPLRDIEEIMVYYKTGKGSVTYNPQMIGDKVKTTIRKASKSKYFGARQRTITTTHVGHYPRTFIGEFPRVIKGGKSTPKPIIEQMVKTYTNEGETILDMTHCNQYIGEIVESLNRKYIGVDINPEFY